MLRRLGLMLALAGGCGRLAFDPVDRDAAPPDALPAGTIYGAANSALFTIDPDTLQATHVVDTCSNVGSPTAADLAMSPDGELLITGFESDLLRLDLPSGDCERVVLEVAVDMFAAEFVPAGVLGPTAVLLGGASDGNLYRITPATGAMELVGPLGASPGGDLAWTGSELLITLQSPTSDRLARVDLGSGAATDIGDTTYDEVSGLAWAQGRLYGFTSGGVGFTLDLQTGLPSGAQLVGQGLYGATSPP